MQQIQAGADSRTPRNIRTRTRTAPEVRPEERREGKTEERQENLPDLRQENCPEAREESRPEVLPEIIYDHPREELHSRYQDILDECRETGATVHIWQDGAEELVVMSPETFRRYAVMELETLLAEAEEDEREGRFSPIEDAYARLKEAMENGTL